MNALFRSPPWSAGGSFHGRAGFWLHLSVYDAVHIDHDFGFLGKVGVNNKASAVSALLDEVHQLEAVVFSIFDCLELVGDLTFQAVKYFGDMKRLGVACELYDLFACLIGRATEGDDVGRTNVYVGSDGPLQGQ